MDEASCVEHEALQENLVLLSDRKFRADRATEEPLDRREGRLDVAARVVVAEELLAAERERVPCAAPRGGPLALIVRLERDVRDGAQRRYCGRTNVTDAIEPFETAPQKTAAYPSRTKASVCDCVYPRIFEPAPDSITSV